MMKNGLKKGTALNINIPAVPPDRISGIAVTRQGVGRHRESYERRIDPRGNVYYWLTGEKPVEEMVMDSDVKILKENKITITPINYDMTCYEEMERLQACDMPEYHRLGGIRE
jgi:5'-nucleotidase